MSIITLATNLADMEEYEALPDGPYKAEVRDVEVRFNEKNPNGYIYLAMLVHPENFPADYDPANAPEGVTVVYSSVRVPDPANRRTVKPFKNLVKAVTGKEATGTEFDPEDWKGKEITALLKRGEYNGGPVNNVEAVMALAKV